ncbi:MAG: DUF1572 domain-containing protein [Ginsengibacter sp.]
MTIETIFLQSAIKRLLYYKDLADKCFERLNDDEFNFQPDANSNSIAVIIKHMHGNMMSRWTDFLATDGEKEWRKRDGEFVEKEDSKTYLESIWEEGWNCMLNTLYSLKDEDLLKTILIRFEPLSVTDAINRQLAHYPYHVGQIVYLARLLKKDNWKSLSIPKPGKM